MRAFSITLSLALALSFVGGPAKAESIRIGGGAAPMQNVFKKIDGAFKKDTGIELALQEEGPAEALIALDGGKLDVASAGLMFRDWMEMMKKRGYDAKPENYTYRVVGKDVIKVFVHKDVGVKALSNDQLTKIFSGKVVNWNEIGGPDLPITVIWGTKIPGTNKLFQEKILGGSAPMDKMKKVGTAPEVTDTIKSTPGAIGIGPESLVSKEIGVPKIQELGRPITLITHGKPADKVQKLIKWIHENGNKYIGN